MNSAAVSVIVLALLLMAINTVARGRRRKPEDPSP